MSQDNNAPTTAVELVPVARSMRIALTAFPAAWAVIGTLCVFVLDQVRRLFLKVRELPASAEKLAAPAFLPGRLRTGATRGKAAILEVSLLALDIDGKPGDLAPLTMAQVRETLCALGLWFIVYETDRSRRDGYPERFRVVILLAAPISAALWPRAYVHLVRFLGLDKHPSIDPTAGNPAQPMLLPFRRQGGPDRAVVCVEGRNMLRVHVDVLRAEDEAERAAGEAKRRKRAEELARLPASTLAGRLDDATKQAIRERLSCREAATNLAGIEWTRQGDRWVSPCPFHEETAGSFTTWDEPSRGFYCFGCGVGGDLFALVARLQGRGFREAAQTAARLAGVRVEGVSRHG